MSDRHTFIPGECRYSDDSGRGKPRTRQNRVHEPRVLAAAAPGAGEGIRDTPRAHDPLLNPPTMATQVHLQR